MVEYLILNHNYCRLRIVCGQEFGHSWRRVRQPQSELFSDVVYKQKDKTQVGQEQYFQNLYALPHSLTL